ncbi:hypothetical protein F0919_11900 [Taibaiella lutea]|uniref:Uncharacterized protein n=1 Tax=Taibaiella lutea TaxID=2608001 RepID=A0A5M6CE41_9BACT|nr:hypothetical protein [Taibaiella lutea]KAA5533243.1 hypothetical protein F0919_11900 [Taibaiella lutea]
MNSKQATLKSVRIWIIVFIFFLLLSGVTAFPLETELKWLVAQFENQDNIMYRWLNNIYYAIKTTNQTFPQLPYGTDWLAFAHIVIAVAFIGPLKDPVRNIWVIQFGRIACIMILPLALIAGPIRHIPLFWQLIDCSFGLIGLIPLSICYHKIKKLEPLTEKASIEEYHFSK